MTGLFMLQHWLKQLTNLGGEEWRETRHTFSPIFTPSKIKGGHHKVIKRYIGRQTIVYVSETPFCWKKRLIGPPG
jgi:hypothetical protein